MASFQQDEVYERSELIKTLMGDCGAYTKYPLFYEDIDQYGPAELTDTDGIVYML